MNKGQVQGETIEAPDVAQPKISTRKTVLLLAWPAILEQIMQTMVSYVDLAMVGSMGVNAAASVTINTSLLWMINGIIWGPVTGFSVLAATALGQNDPEKVKKIMRQAMTAMLLLGLLMLALIEGLAQFFARVMGAEADIIPDARAYLMLIGFGIPFQIMLAVCSGLVRGLGDTKTPMLYNILFNLLNIVLNYLLIYPVGSVKLMGFTVKTIGLGLGVRGAALGTSGGALIAGLLMLRVLFSKRRAISIRGRDDYRPDKVIVRQMLYLSVPVIFERISISFGQILASALATGLGTAALAAHQLANTGESICYMPAFGFGIAVTTLVAQSAGAGREDLKHEYARLCMIYDLIIMCTMAALMYVFAPQLMGFFIADAAVIKAGAVLLRIQTFAEPCLAINFVATGIMRGEGDTKWPFLIAVIGMWAVRLPLSFLFVKGFGLGLEFLWVAMACDWISRAALCWIRLKKGRRRF